MAIKWKEDKLFLLDQRALPLKENFIEVKSSEEVFHAIRNMVVRGAPLIGFTGLFGIVFWLKDQYSSISDLKKMADYLISARPTAVNLSYEVNSLVKIIKDGINEDWSRDKLLQSALDFIGKRISRLEADNLEMAKLAKNRLENLYGDKKLNIATICNTGALACGPMGTALGVISYLSSFDRLNMVYAFETRPYLQGSRLTSYELRKSGIDHKIIVEGSCSYLLENKNIDAIFIGADRIVSNGDTANKIGSSTLAIVAKYYNVPFFVVAPTSSFDTNLNCGKDIEIELRSESEILNYKEHQIAPDSARALNPSFDITDHKNIYSIFCEKGEILPVNKEKLLETVGKRL